MPSWKHLRSFFPHADVFFGRPCELAKWQYVRSCKKCDPSIVLLATFFAARPDILSALLCILGAAVSVKLVKFLAFLSRPKWTMCSAAIRTQLMLNSVHGKTKTWPSSQASNHFPGHGWPWQVMTGHAWPRVPYLAMPRQGQPCPAMAGRTRQAMP